MGAVVLERKTFVMKETKIQGKNTYKEVILITLFKAEFLLKGICFILVKKKIFSERNLFYTGYKEDLQRIYISFFADKKMLAPGSTLRKSSQRSRKAVKSRRDLPGTLP